MIKFFYDSLDTLQKVTFPTKKDYINFTIAIFVVVIISGAFFIVADTIASGWYKAFYSMMRSSNSAQTVEQPVVTLSGETTDGATIDASDIEILPVESTTTGTQE